MVVYQGLSSCQEDICIGQADLAQIATLPQALDVRDSVRFYLDAAPNRPDILYFCIYQCATPIGQILLHDIDWQAGESLLAYHLFLSTSRNQGIGTTALGLLQHYVQTQTDLRRLVIITSRDNQASQRIAIKCGFEHVGPACEDPEQLLVFVWDVSHILRGKQQE